MKENTELKNQLVDNKNIEEKMDYDYFELNLDNGQEISDKIIEIFNYGITNPIDENLGGKDKSRSCLIY